MEISKLRRNPYDYGNPVRDDAVFAGRAAELKAIAYNLEQAAPGQPSRCLLLHGQRMAGKTSLLNATERMARKRGLLPVRIALVEGDGEPLAFFRKLYEELVVAVVADARARGAAVDFTAAEVRRLMAGAAPPPGFPLEFPEAVSLGGPGCGVPEPALRADLAYIVGLVGRPVVLEVDEAQVMASDVRVLSVLRFLAQNVDGLVLVLAGTAELIDRITEVQSPLQRQFREIKVERFVEEEDIRECLLRPLKSLGLDARSFADFPGTVEALKDLTDGNPYEIQLYGSEMFERWQSGDASNMELTTEMLEGVMSRMASGRHVVDRPLIRAVRRLSREDLRAFGLLTSALDHATVDEVSFAYGLTGQKEITRASLDRVRASLVQGGLLADEDVIRLTGDTDLFDEIYVRLWTIGKLGRASYVPLTGHATVQEVLVRGLSMLLGSLGGEGARVGAASPHVTHHGVQRTLDAMERLDEAGPDAEGALVAILHQAVLLAQEPPTLHFVTVTCTYGDTSTVGWLSSDVKGFRTWQATQFALASRRAVELGGTLTRGRLSLSLDHRAAVAWFGRATGGLRALLARNHGVTAYFMYEEGHLDRAWAQFTACWDLEESWNAATALSHLSLGDARAQDAVTWANRALGLTSDPQDIALSRYNAAMGHLLDGDRAGACRELRSAAAELAGFPMSRHPVDYLHVAQADGAATTLREARSVDLRTEIERVRTALGDLPGALAAAPMLKAVPATAPVPALVGAPAVAPAPFPEDAEAAEAPEPTETASAADAPEAPEAPDAPALPVILAVATEWASAHGGLSTFNRNLCLALAAEGAEVYCVVPEATAEEVARAAGGGVHLLSPEPIPGAAADTRLTRRPRRADGTTPEPALVIGHGRITGPAAQQLVGDYFPNARRLHFVHMSPGEIEWYKTGPADGSGPGAGQRAEQRTGVERELGTSAHRVLTVGPRLHDLYLPEFAPSGGLAPLRVDPGFDLGFETAPGTGAAAAPREPRTPPPGRQSVLLLGRTEDYELKGLDLAAAACGRVLRWREGDGLTPLGLVVRGAPEGTADAQRKTVLEWADNPRLDVQVREYTAEADRISDEMARSSLVLVPSRNEGFGLVGVEAITLGVPVLISGESGLAEVLREVLDAETAARFVVPMTRDPARDTDRWAREIARVLSDRDTAFRQVALLRDLLAEKVTWSRAARTVLAQAP